MDPRAGLDGCGKSRLTPGFDPRTVQPVASRYTDLSHPGPPSVYMCNSMRYYTVLCTANCRFGWSIVILSGRCTCWTDRLAVKVKARRSFRPSVTVNSQKI